MAQAVAFALPDADLGEDVGAAVVLREPGATELELRRFASSCLAPFKVPRRIVVVDRNSQGTYRQDSAYRPCRATGADCGRRPAHGA